ncbi:MAG: hypothetical protein AAGG07_08090 [Planctomycetota bacterium]
MPPYSWASDSVNQQISVIRNEIEWKPRWGLEDWQYLLACAWSDESDSLRLLAIARLGWLDAGGYPIPPDYVPEAKAAALDALSGDWMSEELVPLHQVAIVTLGRLGVRQDPEVEALLQRILGDGPRELKIFARRVLDGVDDPE